MAAPDVEDAVALLDFERIYGTQIRIPSFASHRVGNQPAQETASIPGVFGDKARTAHTYKLNTRLGYWLAENEKRLAEFGRD